MGGHTGIEVGFGGGSPPGVGLALLAADYKPGTWALPL